MSTHRSHIAAKRRREKALRLRTERKLKAAKRRGLGLMGGPGLDVEVRSVVEDGQRRMQVETKETTGQKWRRKLASLFARKSRG